MAILDVVLVICEAQVVSLLLATFVEPHALLQQLATHKE